MSVSVSALDTLLLWMLYSPFFFLLFIYLYIYLFFYFLPSFLPLFIYFFIFSHRILRSLLFSGNIKRARTLKLYHFVPNVLSSRSITFLQ